MTPLHCFGRELEVFEVLVARISQQGQIIYRHHTSFVCLIVRDLLGTDRILIFLFLTASSRALKRFKHVEI